MIDYLRYHDALRGKKHGKHTTDRLSSPVFLHLFSFTCSAVFIACDNRFNDEGGSDLF